MLADAGGKDQGVHAAHEVAISAALGGNLVDEHVEGELGSGSPAAASSSTLRQSLVLPPVTAKKAGLLVHHLVDLVEGVAASRCR